MAAILDLDKEEYEEDDVLPEGETFSANATFSNLVIQKLKETYGYKPSKFEGRTIQILVTPKEKHYEMGDMGRIVFIDGSNNIWVDFGEFVGPRNLSLWSIGPWMNYTNYSIMPKSFFFSQGGQSIYFIN